MFCALGMYQKVGLALQLYNPITQLPLCLAKGIALHLCSSSFDRLQPSFSFFLVLISQAQYFMQAISLSQNTPTIPTADFS